VAAKTLVYWLIATWHDLLVFPLVDSIQVNASAGNEARETSQPFPTDAQLLSRACLSNATKSAHWAPNLPHSGRPERILPLKWVREHPSNWYT